MRRSGLDIFCEDGSLEYHLRSALVLSTAEETTTWNPQNNCTIDMDSTFINAVRTGDGSAIRSPYADAAKNRYFIYRCQSIFGNRATCSLRITQVAPLSKSVSRPHALAWGCRHRPLGKDQSVHFSLNVWSEIVVYSSYHSGPTIQA